MKATIDADLKCDRGTNQWMSILTASMLTDNVRNNAVKINCFVSSARWAISKQVMFDAEKRGEK